MKMDSINETTFKECGDTNLINTVKKIVYTNVVETLDTNDRYLIITSESEQHAAYESGTSAIIDPSDSNSAEQSNSLMSLQDLCRVCANTNSHMVPIFQGEGAQHDLINKIIKYLPIHVTENDTLPLQLCYNCAATLIAWHSLLQGCLDAEQKLLGIEKQIRINEQTEKSDVNETSQEAVVESTACVENNIIENLEPGKEGGHEESQPPNEERSPVIQTRSITSRQMEISSMTSSPTSNKSEELSRPMTEQIYHHESDDLSEDNEDAYGSINETKLNNEEDDKVSNESSDEMELNPEEKGNTKNKIFKSRRRSHTKRTRPRCYPCMYCDFRVNKKKLLQAHMVDIHPDVPMDDLIKKPSCVDKEMIEDARMEADGRVYYHCKDCGKNLFSPYTFFWHKRIHTGERPFTCHLCGKQFRVNQGLARHLHETHEGIKNFSCDICSRTFATKRTLDDHRRIHTGERPYVCNRCGKTFKQKASLFVHNRTHSDVFPFKCIHCDQSFRTRPTLMVHITKHTGEKPHICDICSRPFRIKYELKRHKLVHSDDKPWQCSECGLSFRQKRYLVNHKRTNHGNESAVMEK